MTQDVAVVVTVRDEEDTVAELLEALAVQSRAADEIVVVDGGSRDATLAVVEGFRARLPRMRLLEAPGSNISQGRNRGIEAASSPLIAVTDAGCRPHPDWLAEITRPFAGEGAPGLVSGVSVAEGRTHLEACIGRCSQAFEIELGGVRFFPTARSLALRRTVWRQVGGFPEAMATGEDAAFLVRAVDGGARLVLNPRARVRWRPRTSYGEVVRQFRGYAQGLAAGGLSGRFHRRTMVLHAGGWGLVLAGLVTLHALPWLLLAAAVLAYLGRKARQGCFDVPGRRRFYRVPLVLAAIHVGTVAGILSGHLRHRRRG